VRVFRQPVWSVLPDSESSGYSDFRSARHPCVMSAVTLVLICQLLFILPLFLVCYPGNEISSTQSTVSFCT